MQPAFAHLGHKPGDFPHADAVAARGLSLPMFPTLTEPQVERVCDHVINYVRRGGGA